MPGRGALFLDKQLTTCFRFDLVAQDDDLGISLMLLAALGAALTNSAQLLRRLRLRETGTQRAQLLNNLVVRGPAPTYLREQASDNLLRIEVVRMFRR